MKKSDIEAVIAELEKDIQRLREKLTTNLDALRSLRKMVQGPTHNPTRPKGLKISEAVCAIIQGKPGKFFTAAMVHRDLQTLSPWFSEKSNVNAALRRAEKAGWIKRREITPDMNLQESHGKTRFAYFFEQSDTAT